MVETEARQPNKTCGERNYTAKRPSWLVEVAILTPPRNNIASYEYSTAVDRCQGNASVDYRLPSLNLAMAPRSANSAFA